MTKAIVLVCAMILLVPMALAVNSFFFMGADSNINKTAVYEWGDGQLNQV